MDIGSLKMFFLWGSIFNGAFLVLALLVCGYAGDWVYRLHSRWFPLSKETFHTAIYGFIGAMKLVFLMLNLVPFLALSLSG